MINFKISLHAILIAAWIITNVYKVSVLRGESIYTFIWSWCSKSISNVFDFYYLGFLFNLIILAPLIYLLLNINTKLKDILLKRFKTIFFISLFFLITVNGAFIIFDVRFYPLNPNIDATVYCEYFTFGADNYLASGGCDVPD